MGKNYFTNEQVEELKLNLYVTKVTNKAITYTEHFREEFYKQYNSGKRPTTILREMGFDTTILGEHRVKSITKRVKSQSKREDRFKDTRKDNAGRPRTKELTPEEKIKYLEHQLKFKNQQIEALKKMKQVEREAQWKYSRSQKKNSK